VRKGIGVSSSSKMNERGGASMERTFSSFGSGIEKMGGGPSSKPLGSLNPSTGKNTATCDNCLKALGHGGTGRGVKKGGDRSRKSKGKGPTRNNKGDGGGGGGKKNTQSSAAGWGLVHQESRGLSKTPGQGGVYTLPRVTERGFQLQRTPSISIADMGDLLH